MVNYDSSQYIVHIVINKHWKFLWGAIHLLENLHG